MALNQAQIATNAATATALLVQGSGAGQFNEINGTMSDPLPVLLTNIDASNTVYIGGSGVTAGNGTPLLAGQSLALSLVGVPVDVPYAIAGAGTPKVAVLVGRQ